MIDMVNDLQALSDALTSAIHSMAKYGAESFYKTSQENINAIKLRIRVLDNQINREWGQG